MPEQDMLALKKFLLLIDPLVIYGFVRNVALNFFLFCSQDDEGQNSGSILDKDYESKAMLRIAGREIHSDGYREMNPHE